MERYAFVLRILPDDYEEYVERHRNVYPELLQAFKDEGVSTYSIFYQNGCLFNYLEAEDVAATLKRISAYPIHQRWQEYMSDMLLKNENHEVSEAISEVFHFNS